MIMDETKMEMSDPDLDLKHDLSAHPGTRNLPEAPSSEQEKSCFLKGSLTLPNSREEAWAAARMTTRRDDR
jgi:hypothetical protein